MRLGLFLLNERVRSQLTIFSGSGDSDLSWQEDPDMLNFIDNMDIFDEEKTCTDGFELIDNECKNLDECALGTHQCNGASQCFDIQGSYQCHCHTLTEKNFERCGKFFFPTAAGQEFAPNPYPPAEDACEKGFYIPIQAYGARANIKIAIHSHTQDWVEFEFYIGRFGGAETGAIMRQKLEIMEAKSDWTVDDNEAFMENFNLVANSTFLGLVSEENDLHEDEQIISSIQLADYGVTCEEIAHISFATGAGYGHIWVASKPQLLYNECSNGYDRCGKGATCEETIRGFNCLCLPGFERLDDFTCIDTDECAAENDCSPDATCTNTEGSYECSCPEGFEGDGYTCHNVNECYLGKCHENADCEDSIGSYTCTCKSGFRGDGHFCEEDVTYLAPGPGQLMRSGRTVGLAKSCTTNAKEGYPDYAECGKFVLPTSMCDTGYYIEFNAFNVDDGDLDRNIHIRLELSGGERTGYLEIVISGWEATKSVIRTGNPDPLNPQPNDPFVTESNTSEQAKEWIKKFELFVKSDGLYGVSSGPREIVSDDSPSHCDKITAMYVDSSHLTKAHINVKNAKPLTNECLSTSPVFCGPEGTCTDRYNGAVCECKDGWELESDGRNCKNVNECNGVNDCAAEGSICSDTPGSYSCACAEGYDGDGNVCTARDACNNGDADCSDLAVCTSLFPGFTCTCPEGYQGDGKTCEIICPSDQCWNYDVGKGQCVLDGDNEACDVELTCNPDTMDIQFGHNLFGSADADDFDNHEASCRPAHRNSEEKLKFHYDQPLGACGQTVKKTDGEISGISGVIQITEVLTYTHDAGDGFYLGDANIFTDASGRNVAVTFVCSFASTFTAESDDIEIEAGGEHHGHTSAEGSWEGSFHLHYVAESDLSNLPDSSSIVLGSTIFLKATWSSGSSLIGEKLRWYLNNCDVIDKSNPDSKIRIIDNSCYSSLLSASPIEHDGNRPATFEYNDLQKVVRNSFSFKYRSFSFNSNGNDEQLMKCDINICVWDEADQSDCMDGLVSNSGSVAKCTDNLMNYTP